MAVRAAILILSCSIACGDAGPPSPTSGPIDSIVHLGPTAVTLHAVRHRLELDELPLDAPVPLVGTIELDTDVAIPLVNFRPAVRHISGRARVRCIDACKLGDDRTPLSLGPLGDAVPFSHLALDGLDASVTIRGGTARLTQWTLASPDLEVTVGLSVKLARSPEASTLDGCARFRPTAALAARDPKLHTLVTLASPADADGWHRVQLAGTVGAPRMIASACGPGGAPH